MSKKLLFEIGLKALIKDKFGKVLLLQRSNPYVSDVKNGHTDKLRWDLPGGRVEPSESIVEALRREIKEETNLDFVDFTKIIDVHETFYHEGFHTVRIYFQVSAIGNLKLSQEHIEAKYFEKKELAQLENDDLMEKSTLKLLHEKLNLWV